MRFVMACVLSGPNLAAIPVHFKGQSSSPGYRLEQYNLITKLLQPELSSPEIMGVI